MGEIWNVQLATREGDRVRFHVSDVFLTAPEDVFALSGATAELEGIVVSFSDSGSKPSYFAVIDSRAKTFRSWLRSTHWKWWK